jgi:hypothetical protein
MKTKKQNLNQKLSVKENKLGLSYAKLKLTLKEYKKNLELLQDEVSILFDDKNTNVLFFYDKDEVACIQKISRTGKYFDTVKFKEECPNVYQKYLVERTSTEYKPVVQDEVIND